MKHRCGAWLPLVAILLWSSACENGPPIGRASPSAHPTASAATPDPQRCARLAQRGFTPCPPTADRLQLPPTTIRNATNGAVPDAKAKEWGRAFQMAQAYYYWAMQHNARSALTSGVLADPSPNSVANLFGTDLMDLDDAKNAGGQLIFQPLRMPTVRLVSVPTDLQQAMHRQGLAASEYGMAVRFTGPSRRAIRFADGHETTILSSGPEYSADLLIWGEFRDDPDLGAVWFQRGNYGCDGSVRSACQM